MTPGQEALIEAMRIEQARIYSQLCRERPQHVDKPVRDDEKPDNVRHLPVRRTA